MPSVYVSALQALVRVGQLQRGDVSSQNALSQDGQPRLTHMCGELSYHYLCLWCGVGHAAIALCKDIGAEVFTNRSIFSSAIETVGMLTATRRYISR